MSTSDGIDDPWQTFDDALERATTELERASDRYRQLSALCQPPSTYASILNELEADVDAIDDVITVGEQDAAEAVSIADRATLFADVLDASWNYETARLDVELAGYELWNDELSSVDGEDELEDERTDVLEITRELADGEKYAQIRDEETFSLRRSRELLQNADDRLRRSVPSREYVEYCLDAIDAFENRFTDDVKALVREDVPVSIKDDRLPVSELTTTVRKDYEADACDDETVRNARVALEGTMMLAYATAVDRHSYEYCRRLVELVSPISVADDETELDTLAEERDVAELEAIVQNSVVGETTRSPEELLADLLEEHDGNLDRALAASDFGAAEAFDIIESLFLDDRAVIEVRFE